MSARGRVRLACRTCGVAVGLGVHEIDVARAWMAAFFDEHELCTTTIDLSGDGSIVRELLGPSTA